MNNSHFLANFPLFQQHSLDGGLQRCAGRPRGQSRFAMHDRPSISHCTQATFRSADVRLTLTVKQLVTCFPDGTTSAIDLDDAYGAATSEAYPNEFTVFAMPRSAWRQRARMSFTFNCTSASDAASWVDAIQHVITGTPKGGLSSSCTSHVELTDGNYLQRSSSGSVCCLLSIRLED